MSSNNAQVPFFSAPSTQQVKPRWKLALGALLLFLCLHLNSTHADTPSFQLVSTKKNQAFVNQLKKQLQGIDSNHQLSVGSLESLPPPIKNTIYVSIGKQALTTLLSNKNFEKAPIIAALISSRDYYIATQTTGRKEHISAIFSDPSPYFQLQLIRQFQADAKFAFIYDQQNEYLLKPISAHATNLGFKAPYFINREEFTNLNNLLNDRALSDVDFVLATPNPNLYKRENTKNIIFTLLSRKQALIGYSSGWVKSGGLATVYSPKDDIVRSLSEHLQRVESPEVLPAAAHPSFFKVELNKNIMKLLNFREQNAEELALKLRGMHAQ